MRALQKPDDATLHPGYAMLTRNKEINHKRASAAKRQGNS
jgi:hypothetical protein